MLMPPPSIPKVSALTPAPLMTIDPCQRNDFIRGGGLASAILYLLEGTGFLSCQSNARLQDQYMDQCRDFSFALFDLPNADFKYAHNTIPMLFSKRVSHQGAASTSAHDDAILRKLSGYFCWDCPLPRAEGQRTARPHGVNCVFLRREQNMAGY